MKTAALYCRVSSFSQDISLSIAGQLRALTDYAEKNGYTITRVFRDEAESGRTTDRPGFMEMINLARSANCPFDTILIWKFSRFSRSRMDSIVFKTLLRKRGIELRSINEPSQDDSPTGRLMIGIIESMDEYYSDALGQEVSRGMKESISRGFYIARKPPYGYHKVRVMDGGHQRTRLGLNPSEAVTVKSIFDEVLLGKATMDIIRDLNQKGIPSPKGKGWGKSALYYILSNEVYTGTVVWGLKGTRIKEPLRVKNSCPQIIDKESFSRVQRIIDSRRPNFCHPRVSSSRFILSGLTRCGYCGKALTGQNAKSGKFAYYVCGSVTKKGAGACPAKYLSAPKFEGAVLKQLTETVLTRENITKLMGILQQELKDINRAEIEELDKTKASIRDIESRMDALYEAIENRQFSLEELRPRMLRHQSTMDKLVTRRGELEKSLAEHQPPEIDEQTIREYVSNIGDLLAEGTIAQKRAFIKGFVKALVVKDGEVRMEYTLPDQPVTLKLAEGDGVLPLEQYGGRYRI